MGKLTIFISDRPSRMFRIKDVVTIGRDVSNDIQVIDVKVSRRHSVVEKRKGYYIVKDLGSRNGTFLNGVQITESELKSGDRIRVGETEILFEEEPLLDFQPENVAEISSSSGAPVKILDHTFELRNLADFNIAKTVTPKLRSALDKLSLLFEVSNIINTSRDSGSLMRSILDQITRVIKADRSYLLLINEKTGELEPAAMKVNAREDEEVPHISKTIVNQVIQKGISILSPDAFQDERFRGSESIFIHSIRAAMCVPVRSREKILGILQVDSKGSFDTFSEDDLKMLTAIGISAGTAIENIRLYENLKRLFLSTVKSLVAALEANDPYTGGHSVRVAEYSRRFAMTIGLPDDEVEKIELAAFLHDIGKVGIPDSILNKPGKFETGEYKKIQEHPVIGARILSEIEGMEEIAELVKYHHERFDGSGYPSGLKRDEIPLGSRILCIADTLDAITTNRAYRKKRSLDEAIEELTRFSGTQFDPEVVKAVRKCVASNAFHILDNDDEND